MPAGRAASVAIPGHSHATFEQMEAAVGWGVRIDHLFCAHVRPPFPASVSTQTYPMRGGVVKRRSTSTN
ncbi:MAG: hypothetical protein U0793_18535 [Gemmataceae bacterium]